MVNWLIDLWLWRVQTSGIRRRHRREMADLEARLRAEFGQAPVRMSHGATAPPSAPAPSIRMQQRGRHLHLARWMGCAVLLLVMLLLVAFLAYMIVFGLQHGYIYPARSR